MKITSTEDILNFEKIQSQLISLHEELSVLSKKSPNDSVNKFKVKMINPILHEANKILEDQNKPFDEFEEFDVDDLPSNSDVVLILGQYINCMDERKIVSINRVGPKWYWYLNKSKTEILTAEPKKIK